MSPPIMNRREVLQRVAALMGGAISAPAILGVLSGCTARSGASSKPVFLNSEQLTLVGEVAEIFIPRTDTPGAKDVGIPAFIDTMLKDAYPKDDQERFIAGLTALDEQARTRHGRDFVQLDPQQRAPLIRASFDAAMAIESASTGPSPPPRPFVLMAKELTLLGYFTSQAGATQVLQYNPLPGPYRGCVPLSDAGSGKTWATETSRRF